MELRPETQIAVAIKALEDTILPALDGAETHVVEQARIVLASLGMALKRMPLMFDYDLAEVRGLVTLGEEVLVLGGDAASGPERDKLARATAQGRGLLARPRAPKEQQQAALDLRAAIGGFTTHAYAALAPEDSRRLGRAVLRHADGLLLRERAFVVDQGWESDAKSLPPIETLIGQ